jgi:hypothetical protein
MATVESTIIRTFYQMGLGFDAVDGTPGLINVHIDGTLIYNGPIPVVTTPYPGYDPTLDPAVFQPLFDWPIDIDFMGEVNMTISVTDCTLMLAATMSNYQNPNGDHASIQNIEYTQIIDGITCIDPFTNVQINGIPLTRGIAPPALDGTPVILAGQWFWEIKSDCIFEATLNVEPGWL